MYRKFLVTQYLTHSVPGFPIDGEGSPCEEGEVRPAAAPAACAAAGRSHHSPSAAHEREQGGQGYTGGLVYNETAVRVPALLRRVGTSFARSWRI